MTYQNYPGDIVAGGIECGDGKINISISDLNGIDERGKILEQEIENALGLSDDSRIRKLGRLAHLFPGTVACHPGVVDLLRMLWKQGMRNAVRRIVGAPSRGRSHQNHFFEVAMVDRLLEQGCSSVAEAARELDRQGVFKTEDRLVSQRSIENNYSRFKKEFDIWHKGYRVNPSNFYSRPWSPPDQT